MAMVAEKDVLMVTGSEIAFSSFIAVAVNVKVSR